MTTELTLDGFFQMLTPETLARCLNDVVKVAETYGTDSDVEAAYTAITTFVNQGGTITGDERTRFIMALDYPPTQQEAP